MAIVFDGLVFGLQLSLLAVGLTLVYGLGGVLNLAHGQFVALAAIVGAWTIGTGLPVLVGIAAGVAVAALLAAVVDATLMRPVYRLHGEARAVLSLLVTLALAFVIDGLLITYAPSIRLGIGMPVPSAEVFGVTMRTGSLVASLVALVALVALAAMLRATRVGLAIRAVIQDEEGAVLCGIDPSRVRTLVFVLSGITAGLVAITQGLISSVGATSGRDLTILALIVTVVGGLGRVTGTLVAGVVLGLVHAVASFTIGAFATWVVLLVAAMAVLLVRPSGILGRPA